MTGAPLAHVGGLPIEETLGMYGPVLLLALGAASARVRARLRAAGRDGRARPRGISPTGRSRS